MTPIQVMTFKSGKFKFSEELSTSEFASLLVEARVLYRTVQDIPVLPDAAARLENDIVRKSIRGTAAIEGNPLTEEQVNELTDSNKVDAPIKRAEQEILNLIAAYDYVDSLPITDSPPLLSLNLIKKLHFLITDGLAHANYIPGMFRNYRVSVGDKNHGGVYTPPKCLPDIKNLMDAYIEWINSEAVIDLGPVQRASLAHYYLGMIHPFGDGNGRTARLVEAMILRLYGVKFIPKMLSNYYYRNVDDYFSAFSASRKGGNATPFVKIVLKGFIESLEEIRRELIKFILVHSLKDHYENLKRKKLITKRQHELLLILLSENIEFSKQDLLLNTIFRRLYSNVNERTARRDIANLSKLNLIAGVEKKRFKINSDALRNNEVPIFQ